MIYDTWMMSLYIDFINIAHVFKFVKRKDGSPVYDPPETGDYRWNYDYSEKRVLSDVPRAAAGIRVEF